MDPSDVVREIGTDRLDTISGRKRLARFIVDSLEITRSSVKQLESWSLCAQ
jgi:hypothetical protein